MFVTMKRTWFLLGVSIALVGAFYVLHEHWGRGPWRRSLPAVIIAGSGMATGGRVLHHIKAFGKEAKNSIVFADYQAVAARGARLLAGERELKMFGQWVSIPVEVDNLPELSAHADANELLRWLSGFKAAPRRLFIVHGESQASDALRTRVDCQLQWPASVVDSTPEYALA